MQLMNPFYILMFFLLVLQIVVFIIVTMAPKPLQRYIVKKFTTSAKANAFWKVHIIMSFILLLFFIDLHMTASTYQNEKRDLQMRGSYMSSQLRRSFLSYSILKIQRNKYIVFTLFFASLATSIYFRLLNHFFSKEELCKIGGHQGDHHEAKGEHETNHEAKNEEKQHAL